MKYLEAAVNAQCASISGMCCRTAAERPNRIKEAITSHTGHRAETDTESTAGLQFQRTICMVPNIDCMVFYYNITKCVVSVDLHNNIVILCCFITKHTVSLLDLLMRHKYFVKMSNILDALFPTAFTSFKASFCKY